MSHTVSEEDILKVDRSDLYLQYLASAPYIVGVRHMWREGRETGRESTYRAAV